ncbi:flagellin [Caulobacter sp. KR2-114]|uniref:flagellin n=1 Tax=Caulobacter sp. KR2-114 TaxID=3400912 RepID=UPI003C066AF0
MIGRVASFSEVTYLMSLNQRTQAKMSDAQVQEASGYKAQTWGGLGGGDAAQVLRIDNQIARLNADSDSATTALSSLQETYSVMGSVTSLGSTILSNLSSFMSATGTDSTTLSGDAQSWMNQLTTLLNTQYAGGYLFSGTASDTAPVNVGTASYAPTADPTSADTGYYQGAAGGSTFYGADGFSVKTSVQASDPGFEKMLRGLSMLIADPGSSSNISAAYDLIQQGSAAVGESQATVSSNTTALTNYQQDSTSKITTLTTLQTSLQGADLSAATVLLTNYQTQLEASYSTISKLMGDSLSKYLT